jgi:glyoxylase-like metal-dependent hydrolase (beta-lactamase superfamily II)
MTQSSRRNFVLSAAAAGAVFGLDKPLEFIGSAQAQKAGSGSGAGSGAAAVAKPSLYDQGFAKFKVGDIEVTQIYDGVWAREHNAGFVKNATLDQVKAGLKASGLTDEHVPIPFTITVIKSKGKTIMFDSSTGGQAGGPGAGLMMAKNMYAAGIEPNKISTIIVTHFHGDHISGMISKETNSQVFPDAKIIMPRAEFKYWTDPSLIQKLPEGARAGAQRIQNTFPFWRNIRQIDDGEEVIPGVRAVSAHGHTPGHTAYIVSSGRKQMLVSSDATNIHQLFVKNPDWMAMFDVDGAMAAATRRKLFDRAIADKMIVTGYHWGMPGAGTISKDGNGYAFVPVKV